VADPDLAPAAVAFARNVRADKDRLVDLYFHARTTLVGKQIDDLGLTPMQREALQVVIDNALTDFGYGLLLALDGAASLPDGSQQIYDLRTEDGQAITINGHLEAAAYEAFHLG